MLVEPEISLADPPQLDLKFTAAESAQMVNQVPLDTDSDAHVEKGPIYDNTVPAVEKDEPIVFTEQDYDDVDKILKENATPKPVKVPEEIIPDDTKEAQIFNTLENRLTSLKWDHPCTNDQDTYIID